MSALTGLFGGGLAATKTHYTGIPIQTSAFGVCIPLVYGVCRSAPNLIWYGAFRAGTANGKSGGSIVSKGNNQVGYTASVALGLCEGPIDSVGFIWVNNGTTGISAFGSLFTGTFPQSAWGYLTTNFPAQALGYNGIAYVGVANMNLGSAAQLPSMSFEIRGLLCNSVGLITDADPSQVVSDLLTNAHHGGGFPAAKLADLTATGPQGAACYQNYTLAQGLLVSVAYTSQQSLAQMIDDLAKATNSAPVWNGGQLTLIPYGDSTITGNGKTFTPSLAPVLTFTNDDFVHDQSGGGNTPPEDPVSWTRKRPADRYNHIKVDFADVTNAYNNASVEVKVQDLIDRFGIRTKGGGGTKHFRQGNAAYLSAFLQLQRESVMNTCTFALDARYCALDPMDIVAVPDPAGNSVSVRITDITENDDDTFSIIAEEFVPGMGTAVLNGFGASSGFAINTNVVPASVNASPLIYQPPTALTGHSSRDLLYFGASGGTAGIADPNWGGCQVWFSLDGGSTYNQIGQINAPCRQGLLAGALADYAGANPDTVDFPTFDMSMSLGVLETVGDGPGAAFFSLCLVDNELFSYSTSSLTSANHYQLTTKMWRGIYSTAHAAHSNGAPFMRLDGNIFQWQLPPSRYAGIALFFKFPSFNIYGQQPQSLASCTAYTFTPV